MTTQVGNPSRAEKGMQGIPGYDRARVTILGMARQGIASARFFLQRGARVTVSDLRSEEQLTDASAGLTAFAAEHAPGGVASLRLVLGGHPPSLLDDTDLLCLSGGVSPSIPIVVTAARQGIPIMNDALLTLEQCPAPVIGITGSAGKTTTATLVGLMLEAAGFVVHIGGNIGTPLLDRLEEIGPGDKVVIELSSFQLEIMDRSPAVAAVLNITPNHLDRHPSMSHYAAAKANILRYQAPGDMCILNADDRFTGTWLRSGRCEIEAGTGQEAVYFPLRAGRLAFSLNQEVSAGAFLAGDQLTLRHSGSQDVPVCRVRDVRLRGRHNLANMLAAFCLASIAGATVEAMAQVAKEFGGVEHRLEVVRNRGGVTWINDSIATAPERTAAAIRSFSEPLVLLLGGRDKNLPWDECAALVYQKQDNGSQRVRHVILFGESSGLINVALEEKAKLASRPTAITRCTDLPTAVQAADTVAQPGDVVLLAPGGTSFDAYEDFAARGRHFRQLVEALP